MRDCRMSYKTYCKLILTILALSSNYLATLSVFSLLPKKSPLSMKPKTTQASTEKRCSSFWSVPKNSGRKKRLRKWKLPLRKL